MNIARSTALVSGLRFLGYAIGLLVQVVFARAFGAGWEADAWFAAVAIPNFVAFVLLSSLSKALLPAFVKEHGREGEASFRVVSGIANLTFIGLGVLAAGVTLASEPIARLLFPDFGPSRFPLARDLLEISVWSIPATGAAMVLANTLQGLRSFGRAAAAALMQPLGVMAGLLLLRERFGIASMAFGLVAGCWLQLLLLLPVLLKKRRFQATLGLDHPAVARILRLLPALLVAAVLLVAYPLLEKRFASGITDPAVGPVSWLDYGRRPLNILVFLVAGPLTLTSYTVFAELAAAGDRAGLRRRVWDTAIVLLLLLVPAVLIAAFFAPDFLRVIYERGEFGPEDTRNAAAALTLLLPAVLFGALSRVLIHAFLARGRALVPVLAAAAGVALYVALGSTAADRWGYRGLAALQSGAVAVSALIAGIALLPALGPPRGEGLARSLLSVVLAGAAAGGVLWLSTGLLPAAGEPLLLRIAVLLVLSAVAGAVYLGVLAVLRNPHLAQVLRSLFRARATSPRGEGGPS